MLVCSLAIECILETKHLQVFSQSVIDINQTQQKTAMLTQKQPKQQVTVPTKAWKQQKQNQHKNQLELENDSKINATQPH